MNKAIMVSKRVDARVEKDSHGEIQIPANCYWGAKTARAREMLFTCGLKAHPRLVDAIIHIKKAAALANGELERLDLTGARAIAQVCDEMLAGQWRDQIIAEPYQAGSGLTFNINVNEVLANRAEEILGGNVGEYKMVNPDLHVNLGQSANDVFPTAMRTALLLCLKDLEPAILDLERLLRRKALEFARVVKTSRSHLRDGRPITLGQEFNAFGASVERSLKRIKDASAGLLEVNFGAFSVSTAGDAQSRFSTRAIEKLSAYTGFRFRQGEDTLRLSQSMSDFVFVSSALRELAIELTKISNDLRLLNSGPAAGFSEINMPSLETEQAHFAAGQGLKQSFPSLAESLNMVCFHVIGNDLSTTLASQAGQLQTNVMTPVIIQNMLQSIELLRQVIFAFNQKSLAGITANVEHCRHNFEAGGGLASVLGEHIGFDAAQALLVEFAGDNKGALAALSDRRMVSPEVLDILTNSGYFNAPVSRPNPQS